MHDIHSTASAVITVTSRLEKIEDKILIFCINNMTIQTETFRKNSQEKIENKKSADIDV